MSAQLSPEQLRIARLLHLSPVIGTVAISSDAKTPDGRSSTGITSQEALALVKAAEGHLVDALRLVCELGVNDSTLDSKTRAYLAELTTHSDSTLKKKIATREGFHHLREACRLHLHAALGGDLDDGAHPGFGHHVQTGGSFFGAIGHWFKGAAHELKSDVGGVFKFGKKFVSHGANDVLGDMDASHKGFQTAVSHPLETLQAVGNAAQQVAPLVEAAGLA